MRALGLIAIVSLLTASASAAPKQRSTKKEVEALNRPLLRDAMHRPTASPAFAMPPELDATLPIPLSIAEDNELPDNLRLVNISYVLNGASLETRRESSLTSQTVFRGATVAGANTLVVTAKVLVPRLFGSPEEVQVTWTRTFTANAGRNVALSFRLGWDWNLFRSAEDRLQPTLNVTESPIEQPHVS